jgi:hypothetical protein
MVGIQGIKARACGNNENLWESMGLYDGLHGFTIVYTNDGLQGSMIVTQVYGSLRKSTMVSDGETAVPPRHSK